MPAVQPAAQPTAPQAQAQPQRPNDFGRDRRNVGGSQGSRFGSQRRFGGRPQGGRDKKDDMDSKLLDLSRVSHTRAGGRRLRFRAIVITGNKKGQVGLGVASGVDVAQAVEKATHQSRKHMIIVPVVNETISHEIISKVGPAKIILKPQHKGRGLIAGGVVRVMCQLAGIKNVSSKMLGTTKNKLNNARATMKAFDALRREADIKARKENKPVEVKTVGETEAPKL